jgi:hypothetical protein
MTNLRKRSAVYTALRNVLVRLMTAARALFSAVMPPQVTDDQLYDVQFTDGSIWFIWSDDGAHYRIAIELVTNNGDQRLFDHWLCDRKQQPRRYRTRASARKALSRWRKGAADHS